MTMDTKIQTTTPQTPTGIPPQEVPLGIQGTFLSELSPQKLDGNLMQSRTDNLIYLDQFSISQSDEIGTLKYNYGISDGLPTTGYVKSIIQGHQVLVPWNTIPAFYSRLAKVDFELIFEPVKVADCRVALDVVADFNNRVVKYNERTLVNNNVHYSCDDPNGSLVYPVPMYWPTLNVETNAWMQKIDGKPQLEIYKNAYIPSTRVSVFIAAPYIKNALQPSVVKIIVWLRLKPRQVEGASAMKVVDLRNTTQTFLPLPYWYEKPLWVPPPPPPPSEADEDE